MSTISKPITLVILDGWGYRETPAHNAIHAAIKPCWNKLWETRPHTLLSASGLDVGLPEGQMGNSEVGHLTIGAGRTIFQDLTRINEAVEDNTFQSNKVLLDSIAELKEKNKTLHILGLVSPGGVHSHENQIAALIDLAYKQGLKNICLHAFLDGRDTPPKSAHASLERFEKQFSEMGCGKVCSIIGRYFAMDRDKRWDRTQLAYDILTLGKAAYHAESSTEALEAAYQRNETDEFVAGTSLCTDGKIEDGDSIVFMNFRADRARQLTHAFVDTDFKDFARKKSPKLSKFITLTEYAKSLPVQIAFSPLVLNNTLGDLAAQHGLKQLRIAETEKYAHVTFFINGGREEKYENEDRILIPSPKVSTYDQQPEMSALEVTQKLVAAIESKQYDLIICNYANPDMLGHTGKFQETVNAIETIDSCIQQLVDASEKSGSELIITADHGNAEIMENEETGQAHTAHTNEPVPLIYIGRDVTVSKEMGTLADIAPTILTLMDLPVPDEMTGTSLF